MWKCPTLYLLEAWEMCSVDEDRKGATNGSIRGRAVENLLDLALAASRAAYNMNTAADTDAAKEMDAAMQAIGQGYKEGKSLHEEMIRYVTFYFTKLRPTLPQSRQVRGGQDTWRLRIHVPARDICPGLARFKPRWWWRANERKPASRLICPGRDICPGLARFKPCWWWRDRTRNPASRIHVPGHDVYPRVAPVETSSSAIWPVFCASRVPDAWLWEALGFLACGSLGHSHSFRVSEHLWSLHYVSLSQTSSTCLICIFCYFTICSRLVFPCLV